MVYVGIAGVTGYTGIELLRILHQHPDAEITWMGSHTYAGSPLQNVHPFTFRNDELRELDPEEIAEKCNLLFTALPAGVSYEVVIRVAEAGVKVIDLGADFRFDNPEIYTKWYSKRLEGYENVKRVYGLPEIYRNKIKEAEVVGNPGCYPTGALLAIFPLLKEGLLIEDVVFIDSKSGVSGAGRKAGIEYIYSEVNEGVKAYNVAKHRHIPEMEQELSKHAGREVKVVFTPHLIPMTRGIFTTIYVKVPTDLERIHKLYRGFYDKEPFVHVLSPGMFPSTKWVLGSNHVFIGMTYESRSNTLILMSVIDNLVKGAAGQAVQNMNIMFGLPESRGLEMNPLYP